MGLDNVSLNDDYYHEVASYSWKELMNYKNEQEIPSFVEFMELVKIANIGFEFTMLKDSSGKHTGYVQKTSMMRYNFERFGNCTSLDALIREINALLWNHMVVSLINELIKLCMGCEVIMCMK